MANLSHPAANENPELTQDKLLGGKVVIFQPKKGYRVAVDSCLLAAAIPAHAGDKILDLGVGTGAVSLCIRARVPKCQIVGIDKNTGYLELAQKSVEKNDWEQSIDLHFGDVCHPPRILELHSFDYVVANPPYFDADAYFKSPNIGKTEAHASHGSNLADWVACAKRFLKPDGQFFIIYPSDKEQSLCDALKAEFNHIALFRVYSSSETTPIRLIMAAKTVQTGQNTVLEAGKLHIRDEKGAYTPTGRGVLWDGDSINLSFDKPA
jgi:tRNA1(Val) A37 N6-methylase TrmN6